MGREETGLGDGRVGSEAVEDGPHQGWASTRGEGNAPSVYIFEILVAAFGQKQ